MAKLRFIQKAERVLRLLLGLRNERIARALAGHGLTAEDVSEGFALLQRCTRTTLDFAPEAPPVHAAAVAELEAWERRWIPIAKATLRRRAPAVAAWMFDDGARGRGSGTGQVKAPEITVGVFVRRWELVGESKRKGGLGAEGGAAKKVLEQRGLTAGVIASVKDALGRAEALPVGDGEGDAGEGEEEETQGAFGEAEKELWGWYLEWSAIARTAVSDRRLMRMMGFLRGGRGREGAEVEDEAGHDGVTSEQAVEGGAGAGKKTTSTGRGRGGSKKTARRSP